MKWTYSLIFHTTSRSCSTMTTDMFSLFALSLTTSMTRSRTSPGSPAAGSSSSSTFGRSRRHRMMSNSFFSPADFANPKGSAKWKRSKYQRIDSTCSSKSPSSRKIRYDRSSAASAAESSSESQIVRLSKSWMTWLVLTIPTRAIAYGGRLESTTLGSADWLGPKYVTAPRSSLIECMIMRSRVVLPAPFGPINPSIGCFPSTSSSTSTTTLPSNLFTAPSTRMVGLASPALSGRSVFSTASGRSTTVHAPHQLVAPHLPEDAKRPEHEYQDESCAKHHLPEHGDCLLVPRPGKWQIGLHQDVEEPHGEDHADDRPPHPGGASQHQPYHGGERDLDPDVRRRQEAQHHAVQRPEQSHAGRADHEEPQLGPEGGLSQTAGQRLIGPKGDEQPSVRRPVHSGHVRQDRGHDDCDDAEPQQFIGLDAAQGVGEVQAAHAAGATGEILLGRHQDGHGGGKPKRDHQDTVGIEVGDQPSDEEAGEGSDRHPKGHRDQERPRLAERPIRSDPQHAERVHADAPETDHPEVGDPSQPQLEMEEQS